MAAEVLLDPERPPARRALRTILGEAAPRWDALVRRIEAMGARGTFAWDGPTYGWSLKYVRAGRPFTTLTPAAGGFRALVILGRAQVEEAPKLALGPHVRGIFDAARQYPDGRWLFIPVEAAADVADIATLLATKLPPTIRARVAAAS
jgi:Protein of unknown function (DUF3788)